MVFVCHPQKLPKAGAGTRRGRVREAHLRDGLRAQAWSADTSEGTHRGPECRFESMEKETQVGSFSAPELAEVERRKWVNPKRRHGRGIELP